MVHPYRRRYVVLHLTSPENAGKGLLIKTMREATKDLEDDAFRSLKTWVVYYQSGWAMIKYSDGAREIMKGILAHMQGSRVSGGALRFHVVGVSGTIRKAFYKYVPEEVRARKHYHEDLAQDQARPGRSERTAHPRYQSQ